MLDLSHVWCLYVCFDSWLLCVLYCCVLGFVVGWFVGFTAWFCGCGLCFWFCALLVVFYVRFSLVVVYCWLGLCGSLGGLRCFLGLGYCGIVLVLCVAVGGLAISVVWFGLVSMSFCGLVNAAWLGFLCRSGRGFGWIAFFALFCFVIAGGCCGIWFAKLLGVFCVFWTLRFGWFMFYVVVVVQFGFVVFGGAVVVVFWGLVLVF